MISGIPKYLLYVAIPSITSLGNRKYDQKPWEVVSDYFGEAPREYSADDVKRGLCYTGMYMFFGPLALLFWLGEFFGEQRK